MCKLNDYQTHALYYAHFTFNIVYVQSFSLSLSIFGVPFLLFGSFKFPFESFSSYSQKKIEAFTFGGWSIAFKDYGRFWK